jgi:DNA polymerase delta subunit 1
MANVCCVPLSYILFRGQGVKIFSLVAKECLRCSFAIPSRPRVTEGEGAEYQGAYVLDPEPGLYLETPVAVLDYASLYPSSMISENLSHDSLVLDPQFDNLPGVQYNRIDSGGGVVSVFAAATSAGRCGVIPEILRTLLKKRKATKRRMAERCLVLQDGSTVVGLVAEAAGSVCVKGADDGKVLCQVTPESVKSNRPVHDDFQMAVLDGLQLAYKLTANSLYGQMGARTSPLYCRDIAASTTAVGRNMIHLAKSFIEEDTPGARVIYGDTDSVMVSFPVTDLQGNPLRGRDALEPCIRLAKEVSGRFRVHLKPPHDLEYEKTYWPFLIMSKKRYTGNMYTDDASKCKRVSMGTVSKRRDNPPIVKKVYEALLSKVLDEQDVAGAVGLLEDMLSRMVEGRCDLEDLVVTKSLRANYKNPSAIAHKVLAERMARRDPGSAPQVNDRIPYVYVVTQQTKGRKVLQGERIEHIDHVRGQKLTPDYEFYITNQLMSPVCKLFSVMLQHVPGAPSGGDLEKTAQSLLFGRVLTRLRDRQEQKARETFVTRYFGRPL